MEVSLLLIRQIPELFFMLLMGFIIAKIRFLSEADSKGRFQAGAVSGDALLHPERLSGELQQESSGACYWRLQPHF